MTTLAVSSNLRHVRPQPSEPRAAIDFSSPRFTQLNYFRGRVALAAILKGLGVGKGDEVVVQGFTCEAVPEGVMSTGAKPVYADIEPLGLNMDAESLAKRITPRTRAVVVQHTLGIPARVDRIAEVAEQAGIAVIEDCCHNMGTTYGGDPLGTFGVASFYSFEWGKPLVAGLGGAAVVNDYQLAATLGKAHSSYQLPSASKQLQLELQYRVFGVLYRPAFYWPVKSAFHWLARRGAAAGNFHQAEDPQQISPEFGWRMSNRLVRRVRNKAKQIDSIRLHAKQLAEVYDQGFASSPHKQITPPESSQAYLARYPLLVQDKPRLLAHARENRIEVADWYRTVIHPRSESGLAAVHYEPGSCPQAEQRATQFVSLPTHRRTSVRFAERAARLFQIVN